MNASASHFSFDSAYDLLIGSKNAYPLSDSSVQWGWPQWLRCSDLAFSKEVSLWYHLLCPDSILYCQLVRMTTQDVDMLMRNCLFTQLMSDDIASGWEMRWDWLANADSLCCILSGLTKLHTVQFSMHQIHLGKLNIPNLCLSILSQYLKNIQIKEIPILERFSLFICIALVWAYAQILTSGGAYKNSSEVTQNNCRTDRANLISSAPWLVPLPTRC